MHRTYYEREIFHKFENPARGNIYKQVLSIPKESWTMMGLRNRAGVCPPIRARCRHLRRHSDGSTWRQALHQVWRQLEDDFLDRVVIFGPEFGRNWRGPIPVAGSTPIQRPQCVRPLIWPPILATGSFRTVASPPPPPSTRCWPTTASNRKRQCDDSPFRGNDVTITRERRKQPLRVGLLLQMR